MPIMDGFTLAGAMKKNNTAIPIIFRTARSMKIDKLQGFQKGADDYIFKPVDEEELIARIQAVLRRTQNQSSHEVSYHVGKLQFEWESRRLVADNETIILTEKEAAILRMLCEKKNQLLDRKSVLKELWGDVDYFNRRSMDVHMAKFRKYLKLDPDVNIMNIHGKGYILEN